jgi:fermentation-respiration switch protein FrsA (DUF1100 family)
MLGIIVLLVAGLLVLVAAVRLLEPRLAFFPFAGEDVTPQDFGVSYTPLTLETEDGERLRAWHLPRADATAQVVYFHGNGGNLSLWADILVGLWRQGLEVIAVDYRGYGLSTGAPSEQGLYRDVASTLAHVHSRLRRPEVPLVYWGRSIGTAMAAYAGHRQAPDGLILEAGFPSARAVLESNPVMLLLSLFSSYRFATAEWMASVRTPTLVIHGDSDSVIPYRLGQRLHEALPGPKRFVTIPGGDHNDASPRDPERYWSAVKDFIATFSSAPR